MTSQRIQEVRYEFKHQVELEGLSLGDMDSRWCRDYDFADGFVYAEDNACPCGESTHHYHSTRDGKLLQVG